MGEAVLIFWGLLIAGFIIFYKRNEKQKQEKELKEILEKIANKSSELADKIPLSFLVKSCSTCQETEMKLIGISPNARSIEYSCLHCSKKSRALAGTPESEDTLMLFNSLEREVDLFNEYIPKRAIEKNVIFTTPAMPLPYQQTSREPINESMRSEVWRRDGGKCVKCGSKQNLEFDHRIPVSKGGATSVKNLQILCKQCNLTKSNKI